MVTGTRRCAISMHGTTATNGQSPDRCTAVLEAATDVLGNREPDTSNNTTRLLIGVDDKVDY